MLFTLQITLLGHFGLQIDDQAVGVAAPARLPELLAYLVLHPQQAHARRDLAFLLWPDTTATQAQANLRKLIHHLRALLPQAATFVQIDPRHLRWRDDAAFTCDVQLFNAALRRAAHAATRDDHAGQCNALQQAVAAYGGDLLRQYDAEWLLPLREQLRRTFFTTLEQLILLLERQREYVPAIAAAHRLVEEDPLHEASYRYLMRLHAANGDRAGALHVYHRCTTVLHRELGITPSPTTRAVYDQLVAEMPAGAAPLPSQTMVADPGLVGRHAEWAQLQAAWSAAASGRPDLVLLSGDAGIGKTRLAVEFIAWAARQGIATASAHCYAAEQGLAYGPVLAWLRAQRGPPLADPWQQELGRLLPELASGIPPPTLPGTGGQQRLFEALARALLASQPRICFIDDLQWCDSESLSWLHFLLRFNPQAPLLIVGTLRPEEVREDQALGPLLTSLHHTGQLHEIAVGPLDAAETARLAVAVARQALEPAQAARLYQESEGNPLLVVEMVRAGLEPAAPVGHRGWELPPATSRLPPRVQALLRSRLAPLSGEAREVVSLAAIIGREFTIPVLARASHLTEESLVGALDELWQRRIIRERSADAYDFSHDKLREVVYGSLGIARRRMLHRRVAQALEAGGGRAGGAGHGEVAEHYEQAGFPADAVHAYQQAAAAALRVFAPAVAITAGHRALRLLPAARQAAPAEDWGRVEAQLYAGMSEALAQTGQMVGQQPQPAVTDLQRRKINRVFEGFDADKDGFLGAADHETMIQKVAAVRGWVPGSDPYQTLSSIYLSFWEQLRPAGRERAELVNRAEYQAYVGTLLSDPETFVAASRPASDFLFDLFDGDGDGVLTLTEYTAFVQVYRGCAEDAVTAFAHMGLSSAAAISKQQFNHLFNEFHLSTNPSAPGNWLFGHF